MSEDENKVVTAQSENGEQQQTEQKKQGKISGFFKKVSQKLDDATFEMRMFSEFNRTHAKYTVYTSCSILSASPEIYAEEHLEDGYIITISDAEIKNEYLIKCAASSEVRHIAGVESTTINIDFEGKTIEQKAQKIALGDLAEKVDVIKVGDEYYRK
jgi:hypothetical protein